MMSALAATRRTDGVGIGGLADNRTFALLSASWNHQATMTVSERNPTPSNRLGLDGLEFIEFTTSQPLVLGALLDKMGFRPVARHRSREVLLYRQGSMNLVVNAHPGVVRADAAGPVTAVGAMAFRVADAGEAHRQTVALGAWDLPSRAAAMELIIPGIRGPGDSHIYFVDRHREFSIYDVDFTPIAGAEPHPSALAGLHYFGVVQTVFPERTAAWLEFYQSLFGFTALASGTFFGVVNKGVLLESPCRRFFLQLIEPPDDAAGAAWEEGLLRIGLGTATVPAAIEGLQARGIVFVDRGPIRLTERGALTQLYPGGVSFELVHSHLGP
jgi:4-hydroxyphenylpyruvate dioxygenase